MRRGMGILPMWSHYQFEPVKPFPLAPNSFPARTHFQARLINPNPSLPNLHGRDARATSAPPPHVRLSSPKTPNKPLNIFTIYHLPFTIYLKYLSNHP